MHQLFSYGTLQIENVQRDTFGRILVGKKDIIRAYSIQNLKITDKAVIQSSGTDIHPILVYTGNQKDSVEGMIFKITIEELIQADKYEVDDYQRQELTFESGKRAYVYVKQED